MNPKIPTWVARYFLHSISVYGVSQEKAYYEFLKPFHALVVSTWDIMFKFSFYLIFYEVFSETAFVRTCFKLKFLFLLWFSCLLFCIVRSAYLLYCLYKHFWLVSLFYCQDVCIHNRRSGWTDQIPTLGQPTWPQERFIGQRCNELPGKNVDTYYFWTRHEIEPRSGKSNFVD